MKPKLHKYTLNKETYSERIIASEEGTANRENRRAVPNSKKGSQG